MKKTLLTAMLVFAGFAAQAQDNGGLPNGSIAPDFTATDINGVSHHLYEYLDAGKTVIIDISATWCGPCWAYHGTDALADLYESYGMGGSEEVVVLFIEGDPGTSIESIYGTNIESDTRATQGDWTEHSPYPIIDDTDGDISNDYNIRSFPTVYMICPETRATKLLTQPTAVSLRNQINTNCVATTMTGLTDKPRFSDLTDGIYCEADGVYKAKIKNLGTNPLRNATVVLKENGNILATKQYTSNNGLAQYGSTTLTFDSQTFAANSTHSVEVTSINDLTSFPNNQLAEESVNITPFHAAPTSNQFEVRIYTDFYPSEISWKIRSAATNAVVASGGPYRAGTEDQYGGGGPDANTVISQLVTLPDANSCYKIQLLDAPYSDGWIAGLEPDELHGIEIFNGNESVYSNFVTGGFSSLLLDAALVTTAALNTDNNLAKQFTIYPNPTKGVLNFVTQEPVDLTVTDLTGKIVHAARDITDGGSINLGNLQKGMYIAQIKGATIQKTEKIIIE